MKKLLFLLMLSSVVLANNLHAANQVTVTATPEGVYRCHENVEGGQIELFFDANTILADGDQIALDLDFIDTYNFTMLSEDFYSVMDFQNIDDNATSVGGGVYAEVHGNAGSQRITIDIVGNTYDASLRVGSAPGSKVSLGPLPKIPINLTYWPERTVRVYLDSKADKFTFIPYNPEVAYVFPCGPDTNAGPDLVVFDEAVLDGSQTTSNASEPDTFQWQLNHRTNSNYNQTVYGEIVTVTDLKPGFYDVTLSVVTVDGGYGTDKMIIAVIGRKGDFDQDGDVDGADLKVFSENLGAQ